jgi:hypothetical protein
MSENTELDFQEILKAFRELNAAQAQEIAILKATIVALQKKETE